MGLDVDLGFGRYVLARNPLTGRRDTTCRVFGIDAPELSTPEGKAALAYASTLLKRGERVSVVSHGWDAYPGRFDGSVTLADGRDFATLMLAAGHAVPLVV